jgi:hypothetical protein
MVTARPYAPCPSQRGRPGKPLCPFAPATLYSPRFNERVGVASAWSADMDGKPRSAQPTPTIMGLLTTGNTRRLAGTALVVLLALVRTLDAAEIDVVCKVSEDPSKFDHQQITLKGIVTWLQKSTSRSGRKEMTFYLTSTRGCGGVIVYTQGPATWTRGDHLQVEGTFEMEHRREGVVFHNEIQATKIVTLPR